MFRYSKSLATRYITSGMTGGKSENLCRGTVKLHQLSVGSHCLKES